MKKTIYLFTLLYLFLAYPIIAQEIDPQQRSTDLVGTWEIEEGRNLIIKKNNEIALENDGEITKTGTWKLSDDGTVFYILENEEVMEEMSIVDVTESEFKFLAGNNEMVLTRKNVEMLGEIFSKEEIAQRKASIIGSWAIIDADQTLMSEEYKEENTMRLRFEESGQIRVFNNGKEEKEDESAWELSEDGLYIVILSQSGREEKAKILSIESNRLVLSDGGRKITLVRK